MAAILIPVVEAVAVRVLAALGVGLAAGAAGEAALKQARKRQEEADKAKSAAIARTEATTKEKEKCKECPPDRGALMPVNHHMSQNSMEYQARITGFPPGMEWLFEGKDFDGFKSSMCLLQEAKADYDQFFNAKGKLEYPFQEQLFVGKMQKQAIAQAMIVKINKPTVLTWYFQTPMAFKYMRPILVDMGISVLHIP
ncbi:MAG: Tox-REase-5 domain-containing protein [Janthinobacterium svalbardensis]|uniref:Tox-REase-5 domain-containing protein n=1 Tax=Janthinobacterium svalbardensis TaxID=368607 RepID=A0A290WU39_9BURK|nr:Tox-REase-5 domain-containing protein [Janthinobacterium svalbardensis]ATD60429.1 hypothetical protein CNX70_09745 [Janthinobacterium svalbardensis]